MADKDTSHAAPRSLEERRLELDERKQVLEESFPRKWGAVLFSAVAAVTVSLVTAISGYTLNYSQQQETVRANLAASTEREIERDREDNRRSIETGTNALDLYFKAYRPDADSKLNLLHLKLFAIVAAHKDVSAVFTEMRQNILADQLRNNRENIAELNEALPSLPLAPKDGLPKPTDLTVYIQYPDTADGQGRRRAEALRKALAATGFNVPPVDSVSNAPTLNEIRYYKALQKDGVSQLLKEAAAQLLLAPKEKLLGNPNLPEDILEIWIGAGA